jgi:hypothetical protein
MGFWDTSGGRLVYSDRGRVYLIGRESVIGMSTVIDGADSPIVRAARGTMSLDLIDRQSSMFTES